MPAPTCKHPGSGLLGCAICNPVPTIPSAKLDQRARANALFEEFIAIVHRSALFGPSLGYRAKQNALLEYIAALEAVADVARRFSTRIVDLERQLAEAQTEKTRIALSAITQLGQCTEEHIWPGHPKYDTLCQREPHKAELRAALGG